MKNANTKKIYFFETEDSERDLVLQKFPEAIILNEPFTGENAAKFADAEVLCGMILSDFSAENLQKCPNLKLIVTRTVGYDHIDLKYAAEHKIKVCNVPDYGSHVIAEHVFALLLASTRNVMEGEERSSKHNFEWQGLRGMALKGKTLGIIGTGKIGLNVCRIASLGFLMDVIAYDICPNPDTARENHFRYVKNLDELWEKADIISLHAPLLPLTQHMINEESIAKMKDGVVLVNTARGGLIDTPALIKAVKSKKISRVALDVIEHEKNIEKDKEILDLPGVIITPHIAFYADDSIIKMFTEAIATIDRFIKGEELVHQVIGK